MNEVSTKGKVLPKIQGDPGRINQILTNLLSNSIKFTHHGSITLSAEVRPVLRAVLVGVERSVWRSSGESAVLHCEMWCDAGGVACEMLKRERAEPH